MKKTPIFPEMHNQTPFALLQNCN